MDGVSGPPGGGQRGGDVGRKYGILGLLGFGNENKDVEWFCISWLGKLALSEGIVGTWSEVLKFL